MICELCGKSANEGFKVKLEGSIVSACAECAKHGEKIQELKPKKPQKPRIPEPAPIKPAFEVPHEYDVVEDFGARIKTAREKHGWTQEELGMRVSEPHSVIHRMEQGKFEPTQEAARKLEHKLGVRLLEPHKEIEAPAGKPEKKEITLGDMIVVRKRDK